MHSLRAHRSCGRSKIVHRGDLEARTIGAGLESTDCGTPRDLVGDFRLRLERVGGGDRVGLSRQRDGRGARRYGRELGRAALKQRRERLGPAQHRQELQAAAEHEKRQQANAPRRVDDPRLVLESGDLYCIERRVDDVVSDADACVHRLEGVPRKLLGLSQRLEIPGREILLDGVPIPGCGGADPNAGDVVAIGAYQLVLAEALQQPVERQHPLPQRGTAHRMEQQHLRRVRWRQQRHDALDVVVEFGMPVVDALDRRLEQRPGICRW